MSFVPKPPSPADRRPSFWWQEVRDRPERHYLQGDCEADVCIVGAGYTGLWTAYYLKQRDPSLRITILEQRFAGFGASGRNGGWLTNSVTGGLDQYVAASGRDAAIRLQTAMNGAVDEVMRVARVEGIDANIRAGGELLVAQNHAQLTRMQAEVARAASWPGLDWQELTPSETASRIKISHVLGAAWQPHCATINPAKLVSGLAETVEKLGVTILEKTRVSELRPGVAISDRGSVRAPVVIRATEGFTANLRGHGRTWLPMNSSLIVTEPVPDHLWSELGWTNGEALGNFAHVYIYAQRTPDNRIAFGGRGVPYRYGSRIPDGPTPSSTVASLERALRALFPSLYDVGIATSWSGVLGVPRDWSATVQFDRKTGIGFAGGYVGTGVAATNLAGRTLADLVTERDTDLTTLPWVGHKARRWEVEPLRWLGVGAIYFAYRKADAAESRSKFATSRWARVANRISGRG